MPKVVIGNPVLNSPSGPKAKSRGWSLAQRKAAGERTKKWYASRKKGGS